MDGDLAAADYQRLLQLRTGLRRFLRWSAKQAERAGADARPAPSHGIHRVRPDDPEADLLTTNKCQSTRQLRRLQPLSWEGVVLRSRALAPGAPDSLTEEPLQSGVLSSPADPMLGQAIAATLRAPAGDRARLFTQLLQEIESFMAAHPEERPWTCRVYAGTDRSTIFRGGVGHSLVIDPDGRLWRARSYEDFDTTYRFTGSSCEIDSLTPLYTQMREHLPR